jgi:hypothetical protein
MKMAGKSGGEGGVPFCIWFGKAVGWFVLLSHENNGIKVTFV